MSSGQPVDGSLYFYAPNKGATIFFAAAFLISGALHVWQTIRYRSWTVTSYWIICAATFTAGLGARVYGAFNIGDVNSFITSTILIYTSPPILELANYHILGRIMYYVPYCAPLHPGRVLTTFGALSFIVEVLNAIGIAWLANPEASDEVTHIGDSLTKASLVIQLGVIFVFCILAGIFQSRCNSEGVGGRREVRTPLITLCVSMTLIFTRTVYRLAEHFDSYAANWMVDGIDLMDISPIVRYEWFFFVFEATLMLINMYLWNGLCPMRYLPKSYHIYLSRHEHVEVEGPGWEDSRPLILSWLDPFGISRADDDKMAFWETDKKGPRRIADAV